VGWPAPGLGWDSPGCVSAPGGWGAPSRSRAGRAAVPISEWRCRWLPELEMSSLAEGPVRVLVVDDHPMVREGLRSMLAGDSVTIAGEAASGEEALRRAAERDID